MFGWADCLLEKSDKIRQNKSMYHNHRISPNSGYLSFSIKLCVRTRPPENHRISTAAFPFRSPAPFIVTVTFFRNNERTHIAIFSAPNVHLHFYTFYKQILRVGRTEGPNLRRVLPGNFLLSSVIFGMSKSESEFIIPVGRSETDIVRFWRGRTVNFRLYREEHADRDEGVYLPSRRIDVFHIC